MDSNDDISIKAIIVIVGVVAFIMNVGLWDVVVDDTKLPLWS